MGCLDPVECFKLLLLRHRHNSESRSDNFSARDRIVVGDVTVSPVGISIGADTRFAITTSVLGASLRARKRCERSPNTYVDIRPSEGDAPRLLLDDDPNLLLLCLAELDVNVKTSDRPLLLLPLGSRRSVSSVTVAVRLVVSRGSSDIG